MKAIVQRRYGSLDDLSLEEVERPAVGDGDVLVRVRAASVHADVWHVVMGRPYLLRLMGAGLLRPKNPVPGTDLAGVVEAVGKDVTGLQPGDPVFGETVDGFQWKNGGAFAEYAAVPEGALAIKPENISFEQAAAAPTSAFIAIQAVRDQGKVQAGQKVLINGAGGALGTFAVQLCRAAGAEVTAVDTAVKHAMLRSIGASHVVDHTQEDFTQAGVVYDLIVDIASTLSLDACGEALSPDGTFVFIGHDAYGAEGKRWLGSVATFAKMFLTSRKDPRLPDWDTSRADDLLETLTAAMASGEVVPAVGRTFPLAQASEALRYLTTGEALGKIVLTISEG